MATQPPWDCNSLDSSAGPGARRQGVLRRRSGGQEVFSQRVPERGRGKGGGRARARRRDSGNEICPQRSKAQGMSVCNPILHHSQCTALSAHETWVSAVLKYFLFQSWNWISKKEIRPEPRRQLYDEDRTWVIIYHLLMHSMPFIHSLSEWEHYSLLRIRARLFNLVLRKCISSDRTS